jgi:DNA ligase-1
VPIKAMLGKPAKGIDEVLDRFDGAEFTVSSFFLHLFLCSFLYFVLRSSPYLTYPYLLTLSYQLEFKYDGERAQIHYCPGGAVKIFSRNR